MEFELARPKVLRDRPAGWSLPADPKQAYRIGVPDLASLCASVTHHDLLAQRLGEYHPFAGSASAPTSGRTPLTLHSAAATLT